MGNIPVTIIYCPDSRFEILPVYSGLDPSEILKHNIFSVCELLKLDKTVEELCFVISAGLSVSWDDFLHT